MHYHNVDDCEVANSELGLAVIPMVLPRVSTIGITALGPGDDGITIWIRMLIDMNRVVIDMNRIWIMMIGRVIRLNHDCDCWNLISLLTTAMVDIAIVLRRGGLEVFGLKTEGSAE